MFSRAEKNQQEKQEQLRALEKHSMKHSVKKLNPPYDRRIAIDVIIETLQIFWALQPSLKV